MTAIQKARKEAKDALKVAEDAEALEAQDIGKEVAQKAADKRMDDELDLQARTKAKIETLEGDMSEMTSKREKVIVDYKYGDSKQKIFSSTVIQKNGKPVLEQFRIPAGVEVELPVEIIEQVKGRKVAKFVDGKQVLVREFTIEKA